MMMAWHGQEVLTSCVERTCICTSVASLSRKVPNRFEMREVSRVPCSKAMRRIFASVLAKYGRKHQLPNTNRMRSVPSGAAISFTAGSAVPSHSAQYMPCTV